MEKAQYELKKQIFKRTINSSRKRDCILHILEAPKVEEVLMIEEYIKDLILRQTQSKLGEKKLAKSKDNFKKDFNFKKPGKVIKQYKKQKKSQVKTPTRPIAFHSIFDNNLMRPNGERLGCECTALSGLDYENPFFENVFENLTHKNFTVKCALVENNNAVRKAHVITFLPIQEFQHIIATMKPTLYVHEYVTGTRDAVGITYSLMIRLAKDNICVEEYVVKHTFTQAAKKLLEIRISDYVDFDTIYYYHIVSNEPEVKLNLEKVLSIKIGKSVIMFLSKSIRWTESDAPKVIVEKADQPWKPF